MAKRRYDVLCDDLAARRADQRRREKLANDIARNFRAAFASFLGVDDADPDDRLVFLWGVAFADNDDVVPVNRSQQHSAVDYVLPDKQNEWVFVIRVKLSTEERFTRCRIRIKKTTAELHIPDSPSPFPITYDEEATYEAALEALYEHLRKTLQWRPWSGKPQPQMGFQPPGMER